MIDLLLPAVRIALIGLCVWVFVRGGGPERTGAAILLGGYLGKAQLHLLGFPLTYSEPDLVHLVYGAILFLVSLTLAIRSNRMWPLSFAALYLVQLAGHLSVVVLSEGRMIAYWLMIQLPVIMQALLLAGGTWTFINRQRRGSNASDWRTKVTA